MLVIGTLLICTLFVVTASAESIEKTSDISAKEKEIASQASNNSYSDTDLKEAENIRMQIEKEMESQITASVENAINSSKNTKTLSGTLATNTVTLGTDKTFYSANTGSSGKSKWGVAPIIYGSGYTTSSNKATGATVVGPGGYGGGGAWSWVGTSFYVSGTGSRTANIRMSGYIEGLTSAAAGGSSSSKVYLVLKDSTTGTEYSTEIYSESAGGLGWYEVGESFNRGLAVNIQGGHNYIAYLKVQTSASVYGAGESGSDFGPQDGDSGGYTKYSSVKIDF